MEDAHSLFQFGKYTTYVWSAVGVAVLLMLILFWRSQRQLSKQKRALTKSQRKHET